jgi:hypothetical protein
MRSRRLWVLLTVALVAVAIALYWRLKTSPDAVDSANYDVEYRLPPGWKDRGRGPLQIFVAQHEGTGALLSASVTRIEADYNVTPDLDTDGLAEHFIGLTREKQPGWTATRLPDVSGTERFAVIERSGSRRRVLQAYAAKGNTTLMVALSIAGERRAALDGLYPDMEALLKSVKFAKRTKP